MTATKESPRHPIRRALVSVFDKTGLAELGAGLAGADVQIYSTGSTAAQLRAAGVPVTDVAELTGFPECLDGRVKTLHPAVHAGVLADQTNPDHVAQLAELDLEPFDLVAVNLYPFSETVASGADFAGCVEMIDIGGPTMVRAAAKNHRSVAVLTDPAQYGELLAALADGGTTEEQRQALGLAAFRHTASYDVAVATWLGEQLSTAGAPEWLGATYRLQTPLRYGENSHQAAGLYTSEAGNRAGGLAGAQQLGGKEMSYNNYQDTQAAVRAAYDQPGPTVAIIKHANPCGIAEADDIATAYKRAFECDPLSAYGSVVAANREVDLAAAEQIAPVFTEVVAAPAFTPEALELLRKKKNLRLLQLEAPQTDGRWETTEISGGVIAQETDLIDASGTRADGTAFGDDADAWQLVAGAAADGPTLSDLEFAWRAVRSVKSNAILVAKDKAAVGVGMGQVNRVDSARLAVERANTLADGERRAEGAVASSDAFFPFPDGLQVLIDAGVKAVVAPGGSMRDQEVIDAAQAAGVTLYFTGVRHFWH